MMNRREFLKITGAASAALLPLLARDHAARAASAPKAQGARPNLLLLMVDQWRGDTLGAAGNKLVRTPNLDALARDGVLFAAAYSSTPSCTPARAGLLTGLSPWHHGMLGYNAVKEHYTFEMVEALSGAGYDAVGVGKMHYHPQRALHGFRTTLLDESGRRETPDFVSDYRQWFAKTSGGKNPDATGIGWNDYAAAPYVHPEAWHPTAWTGQTAAQLIAKAPADRPFFYKISFARPHSPYDPPARFMNLYREEEMPAPVVGDWAGRYAQAPDPIPSDTWRGDLGVAQARKSRRGYYGNITFIDEQIGLIIKTLRDRGLYENTLIILTADHGDMLGDHHLWRKTYAYEASARIPMIVRWPEALAPGAGRGRTLRQPAELRDVLPTFLDAAGIAIPKFIDGASMLGPIRGAAPAWRKAIDLEHSACYKDCPFWNALTDGEWKYIYFGGEDSEQLFDLKNDPGETRNLAAAPAHAATLAEWRGRLVAHLAERGAPYVVDGKLQKHANKLRSPFYASGYPAG